MGLVNQPTRNLQPVDTEQPLEPEQPSGGLNLRSDVIGYYRSVAETRGSMSQLSTSTGATLLILALDSFGLLSYVVGGLEDLPSMAVPQAQPLLVAHIVALVFCTLVYLAAHLHKLMYVHQVLFSTLTAIIGFLMGYALCFMGLMIFVLGSHQHGSRASLLTQTRYGLIAWAITASVGTILYALRHRYILHHGVSTAGIIQNFVALQRVTSPTSMAIIFTCSILGSILANSNNNTILSIFGMVCLIGFSLVTPAMPIEFGILAYLKSKDKRLWQDTPAPQPFWTAERKHNWIKRGTIAGIILLAAITLMITGIVWHI